MSACKICKSNVDLILNLDDASNITSLGKIVSAPSSVYFCPQCSHVQTETTLDLNKYYANDYKTLALSTDEDDLYEINNGVAVYRNQYMADTLSRKFPDFKGEILDFGCGKSLVMSHFSKLNKDASVFLYDVSDDYKKFWKTFLPELHVATYQLPAGWQKKFKIITSFFSMEHVADPGEALNAMKSLLTTDGYVYILVPNMYSSNMADMLVVDHIHHYSESSIHKLFSYNGFELIESDHRSHSQASIYIARVTNQAVASKVSPEAVRETERRCKSIADFWTSIKKSISNFEMQLSENEVNDRYIVGAGIVGTFIYSQLKHPEKLVGFIDSNKFKQEKGWLGKKVFPAHANEISNKAAFFSGLNAEQVEKVLPGLLPSGINQKNIWKINKGISND